MGGGHLATAPLLQYGPPGISLPPVKGPLLLAGWGQEVSFLLPSTLVGVSVSECLVFSRTSVLYNLRVLCIS